MRDKRNRAGLWVAAISGLCLAAMPIAAARAVPITFTIDPSQSSIRAQGIADILGGLTLSPQGLSSDETSYTGTITADVVNPLAPTSITITGANAAASVSGNWQPRSDGTVSTPAAGADYGFQASALGQTAYMAVRNLVVSAAGGTQAVGGDTFEASDLIFTVTAGSIDYNADGFGGGHDSIDLAASTSGNNPSDPGLILVAGQTLTLTVPVVVIYATTAGNIKLDGIIIATATVPEPASLALMALGAGLMLKRRRKG